MNIDFDILECLAEIVSRNNLVTAKGIAKRLDHPSGPSITTKKISGRLRFLERKGYVSRTLKNIWDNFGYWGITDKGCDYMIQMTGGAMLYSVAKENAIKTAELATFEWNESLGRYVQILE